MVLVIDIGNSDTVLGIFENADIFSTQRWPSKSNNTSERLMSLFPKNLVAQKKSITRVVLSSVVPDLNDLYIKFIKDVFSQTVLLVRPSVQNLLKIHTDQPEHLGSDLFINALMADSLYKDNFKVVVDFGTALTFTAVSNASEILGVSILPGLNTAIKSLFENAALLPKVELRRPSSILGRNTESAIQSGIVFGYEGVLKNMFEIYKAEFGEDTKFLATGGLSLYLDMFKVAFDFKDANHTLKGLHLYSQIYK
jgi:type III pantothenate kinase